MYSLSLELYVLVVFLLLLFFFRISLFFVNYVCIYICSNCRAIFNSIAVVAIAMFYSRSSRLTWLPVPCLCYSQFFVPASPYVSRVQNPSAGNPTSNALHGFSLFFVDRRGSSEAHVWRGWNDDGGQLFREGGVLQEQICGSDFGTAEPLTCVRFVLALAGRCSREDFEGRFLRVDAFVKMFATPSTLSYHMLLLLLFSWKTLIRLRPARFNTETKVL